VIITPVSLHAAAGLRVGPSEITLKNISPGDVYDFQRDNGILLRVYNDCDEKQEYSVASLKSSEINNVPEGYTDIPEKDWLSFETNEIEIAPHEVGEVKMYLNIPDNSEYFGKLWVVSIRVRSVVGTEQGVSLACHPRIRIGTIKKQNSN